MRVYSGGLIIGRIFTSEIWGGGGGGGWGGLIFGRDYFGGGGLFLGGLLLEFYDILAKQYTKRIPELKLLVPCRVEIIYFPFPVLKGQDTCTLLYVLVM